MEATGREAPRHRCRVAGRRCRAAARHRAVVSWGELQSTRPELAEGGRALLYQVGVGLAFLGTVARDGRPRVNPVCPLLTDADIYAFVVPGPKRDDLLRDGR